MESEEAIRQKIEVNFDSPKVVLANGLAHVRKLERLIPRVLKPEDLVGLHQVDPETGDRIIKMKFVGKIPTKLSAVVNDAAYNLRAALDHCVFASYISLGGDELKDVKFPFGNTFEDLENDIKRKCKLVPSPILDLIRLAKPYEAGNHVLWSLNKLRNRKGHKVLVPLGIAANLWNIEIRNLDSAPLPVDAPILSGGAWDPSKNELTMARIPAGLPLYVDVRTRIDVALYGVSGLSNKPAVGVLDTFADEVQGFLMAVEAETGRLMQSGFVI